MSSAKRKKVSFFEMFGRSFMYIRNKREPNTDPCGTPHVTVLRLDVTPFACTYCFLLERYDLNHAREVPLIP